MYDACQLVPMYICGECEHGCDVCGNMNVFSIVHVLMNFVIIYINCVRYDIKKQGRFCPDFFFFK